MEILVKVIPGSKKVDIIFEGEDLISGKKIYKVYLSAKPIKGEANKQLQEVLAKFFGVKKRFIYIRKGQTSKVKLIKIENI